MKRRNVNDFKPRRLKMIKNHDSEIETPPNFYLHPVSFDIFFKLNDESLHIVILPISIT